VKVVSICLSRAGSKRLPMKVMKDLNGHPMTWYTLNIMQYLGFESYVYTDIEILKELIIRDFPNINARTKPEKYAGDVHKTNLELLEYNEDIKADVFIYLPATSPIRNFEKLKAGIKYFLDNLNDYDCLMSVKQLPDRFYYMEGCPINYNLNDRNFNNNLSPHKKIFEETGSFYAFKAELLNNDHYFINERCVFVEDEINIDIDNIEDFKKAEKYMEAKKWI